MFRQWIKTIKTERLLGQTPPEREITIIWSVAVAVFSIGGMLGACLIGYFSDRCGRKRSIMWNNGIILLAIGFTVFSKSMKAFELFIFGRFLAGINAGLNGGLCPIYLVEIAPDYYRGAVASVYQLVIVVSILISHIAGLLLGTDDMWPLMFAVAVIPAVFQVSFGYRETQDK